MEEYFRKIGVIKTALREVKVSTSRMESLRKQMEICCFSEREKRISNNLHSLLEGTYAIIKKTKRALVLLAAENACVRPTDYETCPKVSNDEVIITFVQHPKKSSSKIIIDAKSDDEKGNFIRHDQSTTEDETPPSAIVEARTESYSRYVQDGKKFQNHGVKNAVISHDVNHFLVPKTPADMKNNKGNCMNTQYLLSALLAKTNSTSDEDVLVASPAEYRIRTNVYNSIAENFRRLVGGFQSAQSEYRLAAHSKCLRQVKLVLPDIQRSDVAELLRGGPVSGALQHALHLENSKECAYATPWKNLESTYHDMRKLEQCVLHIQELSIELNSLLDLQKTQLDTIGVSVTQAVQTTAKAKSDIATARHYHLLSKKQNMWMGFILLMFSSFIFSKSLPSLPLFGWI